jgi:hypothetical protein
MFSSEKVLQVGRAVSSHDLLKLTPAGVLCEHPVLGADTIIAEARKRSSTNSGWCYRLLEKERPDW